MGKLFPVNTQHCWGHRSRDPMQHYLIKFVSEYHCQVGGFKNKIFGIRKMLCLVLSLMRHKAYQRKIYLFIGLLW
jgi:hypothetical protein